ncbi:response regulator transcription factor [Kitasatospora sp. NPDC057904]|uniref:response regulator transcription factor n=1 Tax=Kitasatospora sp. NPDC057904 TaxID=3346275 RepID=UPI0036DD8CE4
MQVLIVEGQESVSRALAVRLEQHGYEVATAPSGAAALESCDDTDIMLLNMELPDLDGLEVCRRIRTISDTPIVAFTDRTADLGRIRGLRAGADDCLDKPYEFHELLARIEAIMRRVRRVLGVPSVPVRVLTIGDVSIDGATREVRLRGRAVQLTRKEFDLLHYLARHPGTVVSRRRLMSEIWDDTSAHALGPRASRTLDTHVSSLRGKLGHSGWIVTVRGVGFRMGHVCTGRARPDAEAG